MKTDNYLSHCLEQAAKSPLHYRHGCVIVRGGKIIGKGYNDYRPGFNGGALKHGRVANGALDGPAIAILKEKLNKQKEKEKQKQKQKQQGDGAKATDTFIPFEGTGGGHHANVPLSMHILTNEKHDYDVRLSRPTSRPSARPANAPAYVRFKSAVLKLPHLNQVLHHHKRNHKEEQDKEEELLDDSKEKSRAFHEPLSGEKHRQKKNEKKNQKHGYQYPYQYQDQYDRYGRRIQQQGRQQQSASKTRSSNVIRGYDLTDVDSSNEVTTTSSASSQCNKFKKDYKKRGKMKSTNVDEPSQPQTLLLPKDYTGQGSSNLSERMKSPRLNGADLYVARLGICGPNAKKSYHGKLSTTSAVAAGESTGGTGDEELNTSGTSLSSVPTTESTGSLHEELINREAPPGPRAGGAVNTTLERSTVRASRPCYRCISYMHSVGIKRVFWTNDAGEWEGGKVRDLVDALDKSMDSVANGDKGGPMGNGVFVTKHEVLMLRRTMGKTAA